MKIQTIKKLTGIATLLLGTTLGLSPAMAQDYPKKQVIKMVVPYSPGGGTDVLARITADFLSRRLGQVVVVENKPGGAGAIALGYVAKAPADGYTLLFSTASDFTANPAVKSNLPYKVEDFTYLTRSWTSSPLLVASPKAPFSTVPELLAYMKANPGKLVEGVPGVGNIVHLGLALFEGATGLSGISVPYQGIAPVYTAMMEGTVDISQSAPGFPDNLKVVASAGAKRSPFYPNVPTLEEAGVKNASWDLWFGVVAPPGLPKPIADRLITEINAVLKTPEALAKFEAAKLPADAPLNGEAFKKKALEEQQIWRNVIARQKLVLE